MFKKSLLATALAVNSFAQAPSNINQSEPLDIKLFIQESMNKIEKDQDNRGGDWLVNDRRKNNTGESFIATISAYNYKDIAGLSVFNDINYTKDSCNIISTLISFPKKAYSDKNVSLLLKKMINDKVFTVNSGYSMNSHLYHISMKDIYINIPDKVAIETNNIRLNGYYDQNNLTKQKSKFSIDSIKITPLSAKLLNEYFKMKNFKIISEIKANGENLNLNFTISMDQLDMNIDNKHSKIEKINFSMTIGNLNLKAYRELLIFLQEDTKNLEKNEELQILGLELLSRSKNMYIELSDFSFLSLRLEDKEVGLSKLTAKVSFEGTRDLIQKMIVNPEVALAAFTAEARIEFPKEILKEIYKEDKSVGSLAVLFAKDQNGSVVYDATYKEGQLIINDQIFTENTLYNLPTPGYILEEESKEKTRNEEKRDTRNSNTKKEVSDTISKHVKKYEQHELHQAVLSRNLAELKKILENTSEVNLADKLGRTPLHYAAFNGDLESAKLLLSNGADINAIDTSKQWTPLFFAIFMKHKEMEVLLIEKGADQTLKDKFGRTIETYRNQK